MLYVIYIFSWYNALFAAIAFIVGATTSTISGLLGMKIGVYANARTAVQAQVGITEAFITSFRAAAVMGFTLCSLGLLALYAVIWIFRGYYTNATDGKKINIWGKK